MLPESQLPLSTIQPGSLVYICGIENSDLKPKLIEMGMVKGQPVMVLFKAPLGDPMAVDVNGYILALRLEEASLVQVEPAPNSSGSINRML
jgi:ferrous iron transport protein A